VFDGNGAAVKFTRRKPPTFSPAERAFSGRALTQICFEDPCPGESVGWRDVWLNGLIGVRDNEERAAAPANILRRIPEAEEVTLIFTVISGWNRPGLVQRANSQLPILRFWRSQV
jgi:hypothetical protein